MNNIKDFISRNAVWLITGLFGALLLNPALAEIKTLLMITVIESLAIALSGLALYVYTRIDFTRSAINTNPGFVFLGVHACVGLVVLGVYMAQF
jgi:hypothetical protein